MKTVKKITAILLTAIMALAVAGCHKKDEIAVKYGDVEFTSAYYMCALINADMEAKSKVQESLTDEEKQSSDIDYYSKKIDDKDYVTWVEDTAMDNLKKVAAYKLLCKENNVEIDEEEIQNVESNVSYIWANYGAMYFEPNGVGENTYKTYTSDSLYAEKYFEHLYGEKGEKAISSADVKSEIYKSFIIADLLTASYESGATDDDKKALKTTFENYAKDIKAGKKTFEAIYKEYNNVTDDDSASDSEEETAKDKYAQIMGSEDTNRTSDYYDIAKGMKTGEIKVEETEDGTGVYLLVKQDIKADSYYLTELDSEARHLIADEEYEKTVDEYAKTLKADINNYAVKQFKVKKIVEPSYQ